VLRGYHSLNGAIFGSCFLQAIEDKLKRLALEVSHHENNIRFLKSQLNTIEEACVDLGSKLLFCDMVLNSRL
jgi:hypothetical protein